MSKHNLELLAEPARLLKPLLGELVFVGGSTTALLIRQSAPGGRKPPLMAEVGQSILRKYNIGIVVYASKGLARPSELHIWQGTCKGVHSKTP
jgi:hypothetical protein